MQFKTLDGKEVKFDIRASDYPMKSMDECRSKLQWTCGQALKQRFPFNIILEEFSIPRSLLKLDFFLPQLMIAVEVQGQQHFKYNSFFYNSKKHFEQAMANDRLKAEWCALNDIELICVEREEDVGRKISNFFRKT